MLKKIARGYGAIALAIVRFLALLAVSVGAGAVIVWPLWRLADKDPGLYTILFAVIFLAIVAILATEESSNPFAVTGAHSGFRLPVKWSSSQAFAAPFSSYSLTGASLPS